MKLRTILFAAVVSAGALVTDGQTFEPQAWAQSATTGAVRGRILDKASKEPVAGATVVVIGPALQGQQATITDEGGNYRIDNLPPGTYVLTVYYNDTQFSRPNVLIQVGKQAFVAVAIDTTTTAGETIVIESRAPIIDQGSTKTGITITDDYIKNIPTGRTFGAALGAAEGSQGDSYGVSFSGATALANSYDPDVVMNTEAYARIDDNPFHRVDRAPLSTFSIDVDTASFANTRRFLRDGALPPHDAVRVEELINYFRYDYPAPTAGQPFSITTEVAASPWHAQFKLVRIGLHSAPIAADAVPPRNLVFLLDVSGSMTDANKLPLLRQAMGLVVEQLRPQDRVSIVVYAGAEGMALPPTGGADKERIRQALAGLEAGGSTNGGAGIELAYKTAQSTFIEGGINRVILCTDGDFNVGVTSEGALTRLIEDKRKHGVFLTVLGFGMGNVKDSTLETLADKGNGNYAYIDSIDEARKVLVKEAGATLVTVAKDVKIQVELNPATVAGYRLIGYENRLLADRDFTDDQKDAGEIGAGHSVTALYEIVPVGVEVPAPKGEKRKYTTPAATTDSRELLTVNVRYKPPGGDTSRLLSQPVADASTALEKTSSDFRWAVAIAGFGMLLRESPDRGAVSWPQVATLASRAVGADPEGYRREAVRLIAAASKLRRP